MSDIERFRTQIDEIDRSVAELLVRRETLVDLVWQAKKSGQLQILDQAREIQIINEIQKHLEQQDVHESRIRRIQRIFKFILNLNLERLNEQ